MSWIRQVARPDILALEPYAHAAWQQGLTRLHANELPWRVSGDESDAGLNRYPEPQARALVERLAQLYRVSPETLLICRGSDEAIDLLVRAFCRAGEDAVVVCPPTFGMYAMAARIQGARVLEVPLRADRGFALDTDRLLERCTRNVKLVFLCSPNNPTGNLLDQAAILRVADALAGRALVVVDQAYIEFATDTAPDALLARTPILAAEGSVTGTERKEAPLRMPRTANLAILRTLSKAHGLAGARLGSLIAHPEVIALVRKVIPPYAVPQVILESVMALLSPLHLRTLPRRIAQVRAERTRMLQALAMLSGVTAVLPSETNFLLAHFVDPARALARANAAQLLVRDARGYPGLHRALRISIGTPEENDRLLRAWV
jgi:histidinol-phosphate aminotransferase